ncbi:MAG: IS630 family transposase [Candidatus Marsarchaeota archaeon]|nr:IS630 family transposase [Candidatus Marsarchaeota archaeon]
MLEEDRPLLQKLAKECKNAKEYGRYLALHAISEGFEVSLVAKIFCVDESSIYNWIKKWKEERNLSDEPKSGRPSAFTEEEKKELKHLIDENNPQAHGINTSFWDCAELRKYYITKGKTISEDAIRNILIKMGGHYIKAQIEYKEADLEKQIVFAQQFLKDFQKITDDIALLFQDEMSASTSPHKGYGWTFGDRLIVKTRQSHKERLNVFGATNPLSGKRIQLATKIAKAPSMIRFLEKVAKVYRNKREIWIYLDNGPVHKSELVKLWLSLHPKFKVKWMPLYSPNLNPQELIWCHDRQKFLNNREFINRKQLAMKLSWFVRRLKPETVKSVASLIPIEALLSLPV